MICNIGDRFFQDLKSFTSICDILRHPESNRTMDRSVGILHIRQVALRHFKTWNMYNNNKCPTLISPLPKFILYSISYFFC